MPILHAPQEQPWLKRFPLLVIHHAGKAVRAAWVPLSQNAIIKLLEQRARAATMPAPYKQSAADFVPQQGVTLVPPTAVPVAPRTVAPPRAPVWPPPPNAPANNTPGTPGGAANGPGGGALLLVAALAAVLSIFPPRLTSRVTMAVAAPVEWRRRSALERPG